MTLLDNHLEQISLSSAAIAELPFPPPKIFTNALLHSHDITALIRDTESHERALFSQVPSKYESSVPHRSTIHPTKDQGEAFLHDSGLMRRPRHGTAAATLLGGDLGEQLRKESLAEQKERGEVDVELLLRGAERLCGIYPIPNALEKIASLRMRHSQLASSINRFEARVSKQTGQLARMNKSKSFTNGSDDDDDDDDIEGGDVSIGNIHKTSTMSEEFQITAEDFKKEEEEIRELERKKRALEDRVSGMERDLGGLLR